jgi:L-ascorbate metabolism protein UlaG (beta-lactamase superfamily)
MDIMWYGLSCFRIRERGVTIICDPYQKSIGLTLPKIKANIVTSSHDQAGHNNTARISGDPKVITGPGEYEVSNVFITGAKTSHRAEEGQPRESNVVFFFELNGFTLGHLGDLGEVPKQRDIDDLNLGEVDVLMVPVGGVNTLDPTRAVEVIGMLEPRLIIPMHYQQDGLSKKLNAELEPVDKFLRELGVSTPEPIDMLKVSKSSLPEETEVVLLNAAQ